MKRLLPLLLLILSPTAVLAAEGPPNPFAGTIYQSVAAVVVFVILLVFLKRFAWAPILKGLQDRENKIKSDLEHAEQAARQADATLKQYQAQVAAAQGQAREIIDKGRADAERLAAQLRESTQTEINNMRQRATAEIHAAKEAAVAEISTVAATLATDVASKILRREIRPEDQQNLVRESLAALQASRN